MSKILHIPSGKYLKAQRPSKFGYTLIWITKSLKIPNWNMLLTFEDDSILVIQSNTSNINEFEEIEC